MEFDELQKIWDTQNNQSMFSINEKALHNRILTKKNQALHITNFSEVLLILVNIGAGGLILGMGYDQPEVNVVMYLLAAWMFSSSCYLIFSRLRRIRKSNLFDRSMLGDLEYAISVASYQVQLSQFMRWNMLPIGVLSLLGVWLGEKPVWVTIGIIIFFILAYYMGGWEHSIYKNKINELKSLQNQLENKPS